MNLRIGYLPPRVPRFGAKYADYVRRKDRLARMETGIAAVAECCGT